MLLLREARGLRFEALVADLDGVFLNDLPDISIAARGFIICYGRCWLLVEVLKLLCNYDLFSPRLTQPSAEEGYSFEGVHLVSDADEEEIYMHAVPLHGNNLWPANILTLQFTGRVLPSLVSSFSQTILLGFFSRRVIYSIQRVAVFLVNHVTEE